MVNGRVATAGGPYTGRVTARDDAHRLLDAVPDDRLPYAMALLRQWVDTEPVDKDSAEHPLRRFRTTAIFDGDPDLGERSKEIVRESWPDGD